MIFDQQQPDGSFGVLVFPDWVFGASRAEGGDGTSIFTAEVVCLEGSGPSAGAIGGTIDDPGCQ